MIHSLIPARLRALATRAIRAQDEYDLRFVVFYLDDSIQYVWAAAQELGKNVRWKSSHPLIVLLVDKIHHLTDGLHDDPRYASAFSWCERIINAEEDHAWQWSDFDHDLDDSIRFSAIGRLLTAPSRLGSAAPEKVKMSFSAPPVRPMTLPQKVAGAALVGFSSVGSDRITIEREPEWP